MNGQTPIYFITNNEPRYEKRNGNGHTCCFFCKELNWDCFLYTDRLLNKPICSKCIYERGDGGVKYV